MSDWQGNEYQTQYSMTLMVTLGKETIKKRLINLMRSTTVHSYSNSIDPEPLSFKQIIESRMQEELDRNLRDALYFDLIYTLE